MKWLVCLIMLSVAGAAGLDAAPPAKTDTASGTLMVIVNENGNPKLRKISVATLRKIFTCQITKWSEVPGSGRSDEIHVFVQEESASATKLFKTRMGDIQFGPCVSTLAGARPNEMLARGLGRLPPGAKAKEMVQAIGYVESGPPQEGTRALEIVESISRSK